MEPHGFDRVVKMWYEIHTNPILMCFDNLEGLSCGIFLVSMVPKISS
jgi:hypothetical protein